ncbi:hypothetical protein Focb16_v001883 [Fusarium oxysporum f. sp. cubense]|uniref:Uncharacterized protein n=1 Tax=Fusarium oxysporum f. sp. cubense TaxID=61366 RepID=A0A559L8U2_FUSOC|nr:hypothetical protein Focb16_v001883 [Fusarium oxysporum f. sp. cubense]
MPRQPPPWRGARILIEEKNATLTSGNGDIIANTVGKLDGGGYFYSNQQPKGEWTFAKIFNRGTLLWDKDIFCPGDSVEQSMHVHYSEESYDYGAPRRLLVGYSAYTLEPVLASIDPEVFYISEDMNGEHLAGLRLETISEGFLEDSEVILHHSLTVPGNLRALKLLLLEKDWSNAFHGGDLAVEGARILANQSSRSLYDGRTPVTLARIKPATTTQVPNHKKPHMKRSVIPDQPYGPENRQLHEVLPPAKNHIWFDNPLGFVYKAPYMSNMRYPERLYHELAIFAKAHPSEKFNATAMLFAVQLWIDIEEHPNKMIEESSNEPLPSVSLAVFIVYFEHWLKIHEHLQCLNFIHPFRLIHLLCWNDILVPCHNRRASYVKEDAIDSQRLHWYVLDAEARDAEVSVGERADLYPFMMTGTKMVYPQDIPKKLRLSETQQAMVGIPDLRILGLPSYPSKASEMIGITMPEPVARITFLKETSDEYALNNFFKATEDGPTSQFGNSLKSGTIWTHEFQKYTYEPGRPIGEFIKQELVDVWTQLSDRRLAWLTTLGVLGRVQLRTGEDGLPGYYGMPLENDARYLDDAYAGRMVQRALEDPRNRLESGS